MQSMIMFDNVIWSLVNRDMNHTFTRATVLAGALQVDFNKFSIGQTVTLRKQGHCLQNYIQNHNLFS